MKKPSKVRQLPLAGATAPSDVFLVSQMTDDGTPETRQMPQPNLFAEIIAKVAEERSDIVTRFQEQIDTLKAKLSDNEVKDQQIASALSMLEQVVNGESGTTPYDLWLDAGNEGSLQDYLETLVGPPGAQGPAGRDGVDGRNGQDGMPGMTGPTGLTGQTGADGAQGPAGPSAATLVGTSTISETALVALTGGTRKVMIAVPGTVTTGNYLVFPVNPTPAGYGLIDCVCVTNGQLQVTITAPILALGASYSIPVRVVRILT